MSESGLLSGAPFQTLKSFVNRLRARRERNTAPFVQWFIGPSLNVNAVEERRKLAAGSRSVVEAGDVGVVLFEPSPDDDFV